jgi:hypothetical protein
MLILVGERRVQVHPPAAEKNPFAIKDGNWKSPINRDVDGTIIYSIFGFFQPTTWDDRMIWTYFDTTKKVVVDHSYPSISSHFWII